MARSYASASAYHGGATATAAPVDEARKAAFRARCQARGYAPSFIGPIYRYPRERERSASSNQQPTESASHA